MTKIVQPLASGSDATGEIQAAIDGALAYGDDVELMPGDYRTTHALIAYKLVNNKPTYGSLNMRCRSRGYGGSTVQGAAAHITVGNDQHPGLIIQKGRACELDGITWSGKTSPLITQQAQLLDRSRFIGSARDNRKSPHAGVVVDPFHSSVAPADRYAGLDAYYDLPGAHTSSDLRIGGWFSSFVAGTVLSSSGHGSMLNCENITLAGHCEDVGYIAAICQPQQRNVVMDNVRAARVWCGVTTLDFGSGTGVMPSIRNGNWSWCAHPWMTRGKGATAVIQGLYLEGCWTMGILGAGGNRDSITLDAVEFKLWSCRESGIRALPFRYVGMQSPSFRRCKVYYTNHSLEPIPMLIFAAHDLDIEFPNNVPDHAPRVWFGEVPHFARFRGGSMSATPVATRLGDQYVGAFSELAGAGLSPGALLRSATDPGLRHADSRWPAPAVGYGDLVVAQDGTATIVIAGASAKVKAGDVLRSIKRYSGIIASEPQQTVSLLAGKVRSVDGDLITLEDVPAPVEGGQQGLWRVAMPVYGEPGAIRVCAETVI